MEEVPEGDRAILEAFTAAKNPELPPPQGVLKATSPRGKGGVKGIIQRTVGKRVEGATSSSKQSGEVRSGVRFTAETHPGIEADLALSITRHRIKDGRYVEYTIVVHQKGQDSIHPIQKRYKQFEALQKYMKRENKDYELPHLPGKRWFKANKWDDNYHIDRRFALQLYLRLMVKLYGKSSPTLRRFLDLREEGSKDDDGLLTRESQIKMLEKMNSMNALNNVNQQAQKIDADAAAVLEGINLPPPPSSILQASSAEVDEAGPGMPAPPAMSKEKAPTTESDPTTTDTGITGDPWAESDRDESPLHIGSGNLSLAMRSSNSTVAKGAGAKALSSRDRVTSTISQFSDSDSEGEGDESVSGKCSSMIPIGEEGGAGAGCAGKESDYLQDSIASSFQLREKRMNSTNGLSLGDDANNENIVAANLNLHLLHSAKQAESAFYGKAELEHQNERAHSSELFHPATDNDSTGTEKPGGPYRTTGAAVEEDDDDDWDVGDTPAA